MKIVLAKRIGFCFGVKRAVRMAGEAIASGKRISSLGSIIHNREVVEALAKRGLKVVKRIDGLRGDCEALVISSHGIGPKTARRIKKSGVKIIDTTCPFVLKAQQTAGRLGKEGYSVVIAGDAKHPEVRALVDFAPKGTRVVKDAAGAARLKISSRDRISVLSQTTQSSSNFLEIVKALAAKKPKELRVFNTICNDAEERQALASALASRVDAMLVIGSSHSANTRRLYEVCRKILKNSHLVETEGGLRRVWFTNVRTVGIASGASTPDRAVQQVVKSVKGM